MICFYQGDVPCTSSVWDSQESSVAINRIWRYLDSCAFVFFFLHLYWMQQVSNITSNQNRLFGTWHLVTGRYKFHPRHLWNKSSAVQLKKDLWPRGWLLLDVFPVVWAYKAACKKQQCSQSFDRNQKEIKKSFALTLRWKRSWLQFQSCLVNERFPHNRQQTPLQHQRNTQHMSCCGWSQI